MADANLHAPTAAAEPKRLTAHPVNHRISGAPYAKFIQPVQDMVNLVTGDAATPDDAPGSCR